MILALFLTGCMTPETVRNNCVPHGAKNVKDMGNYWYTFELEVDGKTRKFLYRANGAGGIVEIRQE